jgi:hypothetical protein
LFPPNSPVAIKFNALESDVTAHSIKSAQNKTHKHSALLSIRSIYKDAIIVLVLQRQLNGYGFAAFGYSEAHSFFSFPLTP